MFSHRSLSFPVKLNRVSLVLIMAQLNDLNDQMAGLDIEEEENIAGDGE